VSSKSARHSIRRMICQLPQPGDYRGGPGDRPGRHGAARRHGPTSDPLVLAVGGTALDADPATGAYGSETAWHTHRYGLR
jgi:hypothetical protein